MHDAERERKMERYGKEKEVKERKVMRYKGRKLQRKEELRRNEENWKEGEG